jgi:hypothetical protein
MAFKLSAAMAMSAAAAVLVFHPFLVTDTARVYSSIRQLGEAASASPGINPLTLGSYLLVHLPNLIGWGVVVAGAVELVVRLVHQPRGPVVLVVVPVALLTFLGLRRGYSMAYYIFPVALFLCVLAAALAARVVRNVRLGRWRYIGAIGVTLLVCMDNAFLSGSIKHALVLTGPDTRLVARDYLITTAAPGSRITVTNGIAGLNFWGPPLLSGEPPAGAGSFAAAERTVWIQSDAPRYQVQLIGSSPEVAAETVRHSDWIVRPKFGHSPVEMGPGNNEEDVPPVGFTLVKTVPAIPAHSCFFPYYTSFDYEGLHQTTLAQLWDQRALGWTQVIYKRAQ